MKITSYSKLLFVLVCVSMTACQQIKPKSKTDGNAETATDGAKGKKGTNTKTGTGTTTTTGTGTSTSTSTGTGTTTGTTTGTPTGTSTAKTGTGTLTTVSTLKEGTGKVEGTQNAAKDKIADPKPEPKKEEKKAVAVAAWKDISVKAPLNSSVVWTGSSAIIWGGMVNEQAVATGTIYTPGKDGAEGTVTELKAENGAPSARQFHYAFWAGKDIGMIVWGGYNATALNDGAIYNPATKMWSPIEAPQNFAASDAYVSAVWSGNELVVAQAGGGGADLQIAKYAPQANGKGVWTKVDAKDAPRLANLSLVISGKQLVVWGQSAGKSAGAVLDLASKDAVWNKISTDGAPGARIFESVVALGNSKVMIWGGASIENGESTGPLLNTGAIYDLSSGTWKAVSEVGAPTARHGATLVWTGSKVILFGGSDANGAMYDPVAGNSGSWTAIDESITGVTDVKASGVWSNELSQLVVVGTHSGVYNPAAPVTTTAPIATKN